MYEDCQRLERDGIRTAWDNSCWHDSIIHKILENEKYMGDALLQKTYTIDFLNKKLGKNNGTLSQYYIEESHPAIIVPEEFELVQAELLRRRNLRGKGLAFQQQISVGDLAMQS